MKEHFAARLDLFVQNNQQIKKAFAWKSGQINRLAALLYTVENKAADLDAIRDSSELIKSSTGLFSTFRGNLSVCIAALLSLSGDRKTQLSDTLAVYELLKERKLRASDYLVAAAYQIAAHSAFDQHQRMADRTRQFYDSMKEYHRFLTGQDDYIFSAMLALSDLEPEQGAARMEQLYTELKPEFLSGNSVQALTQVLALGAETPGAAARVLALRDAFRSRGLRMDREYTLSSLGVLSLLPADDETLVQDISDTHDYLRTQKGFGSWSVTKQELLLLSAALVSYKHIEAVQSGILASALSTSLTNIVIAQQTAIAVAAASSAAAASSSH
ncbi:DUF4003 family protein [Paenibacillus sp. FSL R7-0331]|uniref:DUF4003 family protein n=1 Tax=Paenibacillus sp. FSL R7-0331 TaxID=1536773 RepID=UPI0004F84664|nr:DUF4003 family protein [Paenibacillus sp. FSL R7-0331]AIQ50705.1 hypothetical protein R70331_03555 [Paenibacillus sp. FSL R7-0331]